MRKILISIEYDGTNYAGWQKQKDVLAIQEVMETAIKKITGEEVSVWGASRTDAGVHAKDQKAIFLTNSNIKSDIFYKAINSVLKSDVAVVDSMEVDNGFDLYPQVISKTYRYSIDNSRIVRPLLRNYSYHYFKKLDVELMNKGAEYLLGEHDFSAFKSDNGNAKTTIRTINFCKVSREGDIVELLINGNGFLYNMVRIVTGTLLNVGIGKINPEKIAEIIESKDRTQAGKTLPPQGLCLEKIILDTSRNLY